MHALQARVKVEGDITVVQFTGRIDIESAPPFRQACRTHLKSKNVIFDFTQMSFVGSTGLLSFLEALEEFTKSSANGAKFCGVGIELGRVLSATTLGLVEVWENEAQAVEAYRNPRQIEVALRNREDLGGARDSIVRPPTCGAEPRNFGLLSLSYEAEDSKHIETDLLEE